MFRLLFGKIKDKQINIKKNWIRQILAICYIIIPFIYRLGEKKNFAVNFEKKKYCKIIIYKKKNNNNLKIMLEKQEKVINL